MPQPRDEEQPDHSDTLHENTTAGHRNRLHGRVVAGSANPASTQAVLDTAYPLNIHTGGGREDIPRVALLLLLTFKQSEEHGPQLVDTLQYNCEQLPA